MPSVLEEILLSPQLPSHFETIRQTLEAERIRREQFYDETTEQQKAEFINGEVIVHSPAKERHNMAVLGLASLLNAFVQKYRLGVVRTEKALVVMPRNDYEPDIVFFGSGKSASFDLDQMKYPAPDLVVEVLSPSTEQFDRGVKFMDYAANDVEEYWIVDPVDRSVEKYILEDGAYLPDGVYSHDQRIESTRVAGFAIPVAAIFDEDRHLDTLREILIG